MLEKIFKNIVYKVPLFLITFFVIEYSPSMLNEIQPDSEDYLNLHQKRQSTYYLIIQALDLLNIDLIFFQKFFLSISIIGLFFLINKKTNIFLSLLAYFLIVSNIYYTSFSKTILTEVFLFSFINLAVVFLFNLKNKSQLIFFSLCCGMIASLKPIGIPVALILMIFAFFKIDKLKKILLIIVIFLVPNIIENIFFYNHFNKRETVFKDVVAGKLFFMSGKDSFKIDKYEDNLYKLLNVSRNEFKPIHKYLDNIDDIFLRAELQSDYEVIAQFQTFNFESIREVNFEKKNISDNPSKIFTQILTNNFYDYIILSFYNYLGNWSIGSKVRLLKDNIEKIPKYEELNKSSGPMNIPNLQLIKLAQYFFFFLLFILTFYSLFLFLSIFRKRLTLESYFLIFLIQSYLVLVSLINVSTPRYLMPVYPLIIFIFVECINLSIKKIIEKKVWKRK